MSLRIAFVGFRHAHIHGLYALAREREDLEIVGACEEHAETREQLADMDIAITHDSFRTLLDEVPCDIVACADYFSIRGERIIQALEHGRHVLCDKPLCTSLEDLECIETLAREKDCRVGCMLDLIDSAPFVTLHEIIRRGDLGDILSITILGQHPLKYGTRPMWFFEEGKHGGTVNDIGIHVIDTVPWLTGHAIREITAARAWNGHVKEHPHFEDGAQLMLTLDNGCGVMADLSYFSPDAAGYAMPTYWRTTVSGSKGAAEAGTNLDTVMVWPGEDGNGQTIALEEARTGGYLDDFLADIAGEAPRGGLDMARVFRSARLALLAQRVANTGMMPMAVNG